MARIIRLKINWTGFQGAPGYTNLHFESVAGAAIDQATVNDAVAITQTWISSWRAYTPVLCFTGLDPTITELDEQSGAIEAFWTATVTAAAAGSSGGAYAAGSGACVTWSTDGVWNGRRVKGRTFIVPIGSTGLQDDGTLATTPLAAWRTATNTFAGAANLARLVVWRRPAVVLGETIPNGGAYDVNSTVINDKIAQLRSRRD